MGPLPLRLVPARGALVDELVQPLDAGVPLADPAAGRGMEERMEHGVSVKNGVVSPGAVVPVGRLTVRLEDLVPRGRWVPHLGSGPYAGLGEHLEDGLEHGPELDVGAVHGDVHAVR